MKNIELKDHVRFAEELNELIERSVKLDVDISNTIGKTRALKISYDIKKARDKIVSVRWELENMMLEMFPNAPLYTQYRQYRGEDYPLKQDFIRDFTAQL